MINKTDKKIDFMELIYILPAFAIYFYLLKSKDFIFCTQPD
jgi:hypothetical protein